MRKSIAFLTVLLFVFCSASAFAQKKKTPKSIIIAVPEMSHDFGAINQNELHYYEFEFTNNSQVNVWIEHVERACDVTIPYFTNGSLKPGESGIIRIMLNPRDLRGNFKKNLQVMFSTDEENQTFNFQLKGRVVRRS